MQHMRTQEVDFFYVEHGTLVGLTPRTEDAHAWVAENLIVESWQRLGPAIMIDHGAATDVLVAIEADGFTIRRDQIGAMDMMVRRDRYR